MSEWVITTNRARCRDCYRCVALPVKAVRVHEGRRRSCPNCASPAAVACAPARRTQEHP